MYNHEQQAIFGPFTRHNFDKDYWEDLRDKIHSSHYTISLPACNQLLQFLTELNASIDYNEYFGEPCIKNFFFNHFLVPCADNLTAHNIHKMNAMLEVSNGCLRQMILFWFKAFDECHPSLAEMARVVLNPGSNYSRSCNQEWQVPSIVPGFLTDSTLEHIEWINRLQPGDMVDCVKIEQLENKKIWSHARVIEVHDTYLKICFLNDHKNNVKILKKMENAYEISPLRAKCHDFIWRLNLKKNDEVDVCDVNGKWHNAVVLDTREIPIEDGSNAKELLVGYKTRLNFDRGQRNGEVLCATDPRISKKFTMVRKPPPKVLNTDNRSANGDNTSSPIIDDTNDCIYNSLTGKKVYAVPRLGFCESVFLVNLVNSFGEMGGFEKICEKIADTDDRIQLEIVAVLCSIVANLTPLLHREFALDYIPRLKEATWRNILSSPESYVKKFTETSIKRILQSFDRILDRFYKNEEKQWILETFHLNIIEVCFFYESFEAKLNGLQTLLLIINAMQNEEKLLLTNLNLNDFIFKNQILEKIYGPKDIRLIELSTQFFNYLVQQDIMTMEKFQLIWETNAKDKTRPDTSVYQFLGYSSLKLNNEHLKYILSKVVAIPRQKIKPQDIELLFKLCKSRPSPVWFVRETLEFYSHVVFSDNGTYCTQMVEMTTNYFCDMMKDPNFQDIKMKVLEDCVDKIQKTGLNAQLQIIIKKLIDQYPKYPYSTGKPTKSTCIHYLCKEKSLLDLIVQDLKAFKGLAKTKMENLNEINMMNEQFTEYTLVEESSYIAYIIDKLEFIFYLHTNGSAGDMVINYKLLDALWETLFDGSFMQRERDAFFKWINQISELKAVYLLPFEELKTLFREKVISRENQIAFFMSPEGVECFKSLFLLVNKNLQKIYSGLKSSYILIESLADQPRNSLEQTKQQERQIETSNSSCGSKSKFEGIEQIMELILTSQNANIAERALDFVNDIHLNFSHDFKEITENFAGECLNICMKSLEKAMEIKNQISETSFVNRCLRSLKIINNVLDESEKNGIGNLITHSKLAKGEPITLLIMNDGINISPNIPKKAEVTLNSNDTVLDLRVKIAIKFKVTWDQVRLSDGKRIIGFNQNGRTLEDIQLGNGMKLLTSYQVGKPIPKARLLVDQNTINPTLKNIFIEWFEMFSDDGLMGPEHCAAFIHSCTKDHCRADDRRVRSVFEQYDDDRDSYLTLDNFLRLYLVACKNDPSIVWVNLYAHYYANNLKKVTELEVEHVETSLLPRYLLSTNEAFISSLFSLLSSEDTVAYEALKLLNRMPTDQKIIREVIMLKGIREVLGSDNNKGWDNLLDVHSKYRLLYSLNVLDYLANSGKLGQKQQEEIEKEIEKMLEPHNPILIEYKRTWKQDFIMFGGLRHLLKIFKVLRAKDPNQASYVDLRIMSYALKIIKDLLLTLPEVSQQDIFKNSYLIKLICIATDLIQGEISFAMELCLKGNLAGQKKREPNVLDVEAFRIVGNKVRNSLGSQYISVNNINIEDPYEVVSLVEYETYL